jgi:hypothetical protein
MHFHLGWSVPTQDFGHVGYYAGDRRSEHVGHQQHIKASEQENQTVRNAKPDNLVSQEAAAVPNRQQEQKATTGASVDQLGGSQGQARPGSKSSTNGEMKPDVETSIEEVATEHNKVSGEKTETKTETGTNSRQPQNRTVLFPKPDHPVSVAPGQKQPSRTTVLRTAPAPRWCPLGLTPSQRRRIQRMRAQKMREEVAVKESDEYFNTIQPVISMKQEWRVKEKVDAPAPTTSDDDMDLLDDDEAPLIKDESPPPTGMDINVVFTLLAEFRGIEEEVTQMCLDPKEAVFEKPEESN